VIGLVRHHPRAVLIVLAFTMGGSLFFYTFTTYMQKYLVNTAHMDATVVTGAAPLLFALGRATDPYHALFLVLVALVIASFGLLRNSDEAG